MKNNNKTPLLRAFLSLFAVPSPQNEQFYAREDNYLIELGVKDFIKIDDLWKAVW